MTHKAPLTIQTKDQLRQLKNNLAYIFGDDYIGREPDVDESISVPEDVCTTKALSQPPRSRSSTIGSVLTFHDGGAFAMIHLRWSPEEAATYSLGTHAGWHKYGDAAKVETYYSAIDSVLEQLGVLPDAYEVSCPCGAEAVVPGQQTAISEYLSDHYDSDNHAGRVSNSTLSGREITAVTGSCPDSEAATQSPA
jgi:hypothetical protein